MRQHFDLLVIGSGPAGHHAAIQGSKLGKSVALVERPRNIGGVCFNTGTVPSKALREAVLNSTDRLAPSNSKQSMGDLLGRCQEVVRKEVDVYRAHFARNGVELFEGTGSFIDPHTLMIEQDGRSFQASADFILIACGTVPAKNDDFPIDGRRIIDADGIFSLPSIPKTMIVVGGGVIGLEYASMFARLRTRVTLLDGRNRLLEFVDGEIVEALTFYLRDAGVTPRLGEKVAYVEAGEHEVVAHTESRKVLRAEVALYAAGRQGATEGLNLEEAGLKADSRGRIAVDAEFRTETPHIFAAGDVVGFPSLASTSMEQGRVAAACAFGASAAAMPEVFPFGIYTIPEISFVGKTEEELTQESVPYEVGLARYREIARGNILGDNTGRLKLVFHRETLELLGVHIIGEGATELVHIGQAVIAHGGSVRYFVDHVFNYPTLAECYKVAALNGLNKIPAAQKAGESRRRKAA